MAIYRTILTCIGLTEDEGRNAPRAVLDEFRERPWHHNVLCEWNGTKLKLTAENNFDDKGEALLDEYWDIVIACVPTEQTLRFEIETTTEISS